MKYSLKVFVSIFFLVSPLASATQLDFSKLKLPVQKTVLPNGLTILLNADHSVPTVSYQMWFRVGSKYEDPGFTGIAHLFEHMMFKGGKRYSGDQFKSLLQANGVTYNAFTTYDYTGYYEDLPPDKLKLILDIESDRVENLSLNAENLKSEREVVKEERRMRVDNSIGGNLNEVLWSHAYHVHPYKWPVIGWMSDIDAITLERCKSFFHTYYSVSNAVLSISGDIDPERTLGWVKDYFGRLPKVIIPPTAFENEPPQTSEVKLTVKKPVQAETVAVAYHITEAGSPDSYVLDLIANMLTEGESSRLFRKLVYSDQTALGVESFSTTPKDPGLFEIEMQLKPKINFEKVLPALYEEIARLDDVSEKELDKAKNQIMKHWVDSMKTIHKKAYNLVLNEIVTGSYENLFNDLAKYQSVSSQDIRRVAKKYFQSSNRTVVAIVPEKGVQK